MFGANLKATNSSFRKGMTFCRSIYVKKVMKLLALIFEQPSYIWQIQRAVFKYMDQTVRVRSLVHAFVVHMQQNRVFQINLRFCAK